MNPDVPEARGPIRSELGAYLPYFPATRRQDEGAVPEDTELSQYEHMLAAALPSDPNDLLSDDQKSGLSADLAKLARLRQEAEIASATLRLA